MLRDIRYAARQLSRRPLATIAAIVSLAAGIGANTAVFSLLNVVFLQTLPIREPDRLVRIMRVDPAKPEHMHRLSPLMLDLIRARHSGFSGTFAWSGGGISNIEANGSIYVGSTTQATADYFETLGVRPQLGRFFSSSDPLSVAVDFASVLEAEIRSGSSSNRQDHSSRGHPPNDHRCCAGGVRRSDD